MDSCDVGNIIKMRTIKENKVIYDYYNENPATTKFLQNLERLIKQAIKEEVYSAKILSRCYDEAIAHTNCEKCNHKGLVMFRNALYCRQHSYDQE